MTSRLTSDSNTDRFTIPVNRFPLSARVMRFGGRDEGRGPVRRLWLRSRMEMAEREEREAGIRPEKELLESSRVWREERFVRKEEGIIGPVKLLEVKTRDRRLDRKAREWRNRPAEEIVGKIEGVELGEIGYDGGELAGVSGAIKNDGGDPSVSGAGDAAEEGCARVRGWGEVPRGQAGEGWDRGWDDGGLQCSKGGRVGGVGDRCSR
ncbi:hypothetical protein KSP39_PZI015335 [Platanthera zijinensis]|uniref:Uncharacterized protein n=1 Tax=Platanthera zijinensis TaxID=2320716 RepID=A0AAP0G244_9ASPA